MPRCSTSIRRSTAWLKNKDRRVPVLHRRKLAICFGENIMNERGRVQKEGISRFPVLERLQSREPLRTVFG